jgi:hypothetical protein
VNALTEAAELPDAEDELTENRPSAGLRRVVHALRSRLVFVEDGRLRRRLRENSKSKRAASTLEHGLLAEVLRQLSVQSLNNYTRYTFTLGYRVSPAVASGTGRRCSTPRVQATKKLQSLYFYTRLSASVRPLQAS